MRTLGIVAVSFVGVVGVLLVATGYLALLGLPLVAGAVLVLARNVAKPTRAEEMAETARAASKPDVARVIGTRGDCPRAYEIGTEWQLDANGKIIAPPCRPAVEAINTLQDGWVRCGDQQVACVCPLGKQCLILALGAKQPAAVAH